PPALPPQVLSRRAPYQRHPGHPRPDEPYSHVLAHLPFLKECWFRKKRVLKQCGLELRELRLAVETGQEPEVVIREAADVANFALIVADLYAKAPASEIFPSASG